MGSNAYKKYQLQHIVQIIEAKHIYVHTGEKKCIGLDIMGGKSFEITNKPRRQKK